MKRPLLSLALTCISVLVVGSLFVMVRNDHMHSKLGEEYLGYFARPMNLPSGIYWFVDDPQDGLGVGFYHWPLGPAEYRLRDGSLRYSESAGPPASIDDYYPIDSGSDSGD